MAAITVLRSSLFRKRADIRKFFVFISQVKHSSIFKPQMFKNIVKKPPSTETPALAESTNMGIWVVGIKNQLCIRGS